MEICDRISNNKEVKLALPLCEQGRWESSEVRLGPRAPFPPPTQSSNRPTVSLDLLNTRQNKQDTSFLFHCPKVLSTQMRRHSSEAQLLSSLGLFSPLSITPAVNIVPCTQ